MTGSRKRRAGGVGYGPLDDVTLDNVMRKYETERWRSAQPKGNPSWRDVDLLGPMSGGAAYPSQKPVKLNAFCAITA